MEKKYLKSELESFMNSGVIEFIDSEDLSKITKESVVDIIKSVGSGSTEDLGVIATELRSFRPIKYYDDSTLIEKTGFVREAQIKWDKQIDTIQKSISGVFMDTELNKSLGRVGEKYMLSELGKSADPIFNEDLLIQKGRKPAPVGTVDKYGYVKQSDGSWKLPKKGNGAPKAEESKEGKKEEELSTKFKKLHESGYKGGKKYFVAKGDDGFYLAGTEKEVIDFVKKHPNLKAYEVYDHQLQHEINVSKVGKHRDLEDMLDDFSRLNEKPDFDEETDKAGLKILNRIGSYLEDKNVSIEEFNNMLKTRGLDLDYYALIVNSNTDKGDSKKGDNTGKSGKLSPKVAYDSLPTPERKAVVSAPKESKPDYLKNIKAVIKGNESSIKDAISRLSIVDLGSYGTQTTLFSDLPESLKGGLFVGKSGENYYLIDTQGYDYARYVSKLGYNPEPDNKGEGDKSAPQDNQKKFSEAYNKAKTVLADFAKNNGMHGAGNSYSKNFKEDDIIRSASVKISEPSLTELKDGNFDTNKLFSANIGAVQGGAPEKFLKAVAEKRFSTPNEALRYIQSVKAKVEDFYSSF